MLHLSLLATILPCSLFLFMLIKFFNAHTAKNSNYNLNLPPGPKKLPLIGNLHQLIGPELPHNRLNNLAKVHGPIYHLKAGELTIIVLSSHEAAQEVLKTQEINFAQRPLFQSVVMMMVDVNSSLIFAPHGEYWRQIRRICVSELLSTKRVGLFRSIREDEMRNLIDFMHSSRGRPFNLSSKISSCLMAIVLKATFGESCKQKDELLSALKEGVKQSGGFSVADIFPSCRILRYVDGTKRKLDGIRRKYDETMDCIMNDHKKHRETMSSAREESSVKEDFVDILLRMQESNETEFHLTTNNIKGVLLDLFAGASDAPAITVEWAMSELLKNPAVMAKAQAEVREGLKGKGDVQESDLEEFKYLKAVIKEVLRLHPPVPLIPREPSDGCKINGYDVPKKSRVIIHAGAMGRDPNYWRDPERFEPERFLESSVDFVGANYHFVPFGSGRRMCPGIAFANASMELLLAILLGHFDWALLNGQTPEELDMSEAFGLSIRRKNDLYVMATPHNPAGA